MEVTHYDDAWYDGFLQAARERGGDLMVSLGMRPVESSREHAIVDMALSPANSQPGGLFSAGAVMSLADACAAWLCVQAATPEGKSITMYPVCVQVSANLLRNASSGRARATSTFLQQGRTLMVVDTTVVDDADRELARVTTTHVLRAIPPSRPRPLH